MAAPTATVGMGTPASCTAAALATAVAGGGVIHFNCGPNPVNIVVSSQIDIPTNVDTVIDGNNLVTLDGGGTTRILRAWRNNYRVNTQRLTLQRIRLINGQAPGGGYVAQNPANPDCAYGYATGGGGAIELRDMNLNLYDVEFSNNHAATPGPDIGGGAVYAAGTLDVTGAFVRFINNSGANGGAVGLLQTNGRFYNSRFQNNTANGVGRNFVAPGCPGVGHVNQGGAGGNGGAIVIDGADDTEQRLCGTTVVGNQANELGGGVFRTSNGVGRPTVIDRSRIETNTAPQAGGLFIVNSNPLQLDASTLSGNSATSFGGVQVVNSRLDFQNTTFSGNQSQGHGAAVWQENSSAASVIRNVTFAGNQILGASGAAAALGQAINFPVHNSVFFNNTIASTQFQGVQCWGSAPSGTGNLRWPVKVPAPTAGAESVCVPGILVANPMLGALADNGGPTPTLMPAPGSPLRDAGTNCPATDQRGQPRPGPGCTIGAVE